MSTQDTSDHYRIDPDQDPSSYWETHYGQRERIWSGRVNQTMAELVEPLAPGTALDLGCGEGGDAIWLALHGWNTTGVDISATAVARAEEAARNAHVAASQIRFTSTDLDDWTSEASFDLVTASFFQSPVRLERERILHDAARRVNPGGHLVVVAHAAAPEGSGHEDHDFPSPESELAALELDEGWEVQVAEIRTRRGTGPDGREIDFEDSVVMVRRAGHRPDLPEGTD